MASSAPKRTTRTSGPAPVMEEAPKVLKPRARKTVKPTETQQQPAPIDVATADGLEASGSLADSEVLAAVAPQDAVEEELRLQHEREKQEKEERSKRKTEGPLSTKRFQALEHLLQQSEAYSQFLAEQLANIDEAAKEQPEEGQAAEAVEEAPAPKKGGKKKRKAAAEAAAAEAKKAKSSKTPTEELLPLLQADLRDYQIKGVKWLIGLHQNGINGILADQMGLGKTVQTIGFLSHLKAVGARGPYLVVGPLSTLANWVNEFQRFLPSMPCLLYHGSKQERETLRATRLGLVGSSRLKLFQPQDMPVVVTSYEIVIADIKYLAKIKWQYLVVDEGHRLKNFNCKLIRELKTLQTENRLLLTGTPLQNNLAELWSLLNFLMPEVFGNVDDFEAWFEFSSSVGQAGADKEIVAAEQRNKVITKLHAILRPFVLRRLKSDVEINLPRKQEIILYAPMTQTQKHLNEQLRDGTLMKEMAALAESSGINPSSATRLNNVLMQMRKVCNHPDLITSHYTQDVNYPTPEELVEQCGKMQLLDKLLTKLRAGGHKVLIFSQMTRMLDLLQSYLEQLGHTACRIDGSIPWQERQENIRSFNEDKETWLFLLSTRAGGLGINLTAADTVIIYDSDWNPHQDLQAMDRCHRIGQQKPVLVFRLAAAHSVEGRMLKRAADKMALERVVIKKGAFIDVRESQKNKKEESSNLSAAELLELLEGDYKMESVAQSGTVDDQMMDKLLDRSHLEAGSAMPYSAMGVGYEVVQHTSNNSMISGINA